MPYGTGLAVIAVCLLVVFATFFYLVVNARSVAKVFRGGRDIAVGAGSDRKTASRGAAIAAIVIHFVAWGVAAFVWLGLQAENRATGPDVTPLEEAGVVSGNGSSPE